MTDDSKIYNSEAYSATQPEAVDIAQIPSADSALDYSKPLLRRGFDNQKFAAYTVKLPADQLAALQSIWLELKRLYGADSPDKSGMIQQAIAGWLKRWDGPDKQELLRDLLDIRQDTRRRQYKK
jgi:hypothetical protein